MVQKLVQNSIPDRRVCFYITQKLNFRPLGRGEGGVAESGALLGPPLVQVLVKPETEFARARPNHQAGRASLDEQLVGSGPCVHLVRDIR